MAVDALPVAWMALCMGIGYGAINAFISIFAQSRGIQNPGFYFMVQAIALLVSRTFAGRLADRVGRAIVIIPGVILMAVALAMLPLAHGFPYFVISASLFGIGFGSAQPATMALLIDRIRPEQRGLATGTYFTGFDVGLHHRHHSAGSGEPALGFWRDVVDFGSLHPAWSGRYHGRPPPQEFNCAVADEWTLPAIFSTRWRHIMLHHGPTENRGC